MTGRVLRPKFITRADVRSRRSGAIFVYSDNMRRQGYGGQAKEMRGEPNAMGIPTKWAPDRREQSYFVDDDFGRVRTDIDDAFWFLRELRATGMDIVIPADGLGTGLAELPTRAPRIHRYIEKHIAALEAAAQQDDKEVV